LLQFDLEYHPCQSGTKSMQIVMKAHVNAVCFFLVKFCIEVEVMPGDALKN